MKKGRRLTNLFYLRDMIQFKNSCSFCSNALPRRFSATIFPSGLTKTLKGIPLNWYRGTTSLCQYLRSLICVHVKLSSFIACVQASFCPGRSSETPSIAKFLFLNCLNACTTLGFSLLHGPHQLAQKSTSTYLPRNELSLTVLPSVSGKEISGAVFPTHTVFGIVPSTEFRIPAISVRSGNLLSISVNKATTSVSVKPFTLKFGSRAIPW